MRHRRSESTSRDRALSGRPRFFVPVDLKTAAKRLGIYLGPQALKRDGRLKGTKLAVGKVAGRRSGR